MNLVSPMFSSAVEIDEGDVFSLILENQKLFKRYLIDLHNQVNDLDGEIVLSENNKILSIKKHIDILYRFTPFEINTKTMLNHIHSKMNEKAINAENYLKTAEVLSIIQRYMEELCFDMPIEMEYQKLDIFSVIKSIHPTIVNDNSNDIETIIDYMSLMLDFEPKKLFVFVNLRSYFLDEEIELFVKTVKLRQMQVLLLESSSRQRIDGIKQLTIDCDLCEI